ncbi:MAG: beta-ketoacyl-[acyl-carrier-protein] synthase family protein [Bdellovibrionaceae bacterium]|nr:beta-ketoacyl-[acyl-carrier-protein] synthase family protein [Bdellovibrio sp.]
MTTKLIAVKAVGSEAFCSSGVNKNEIFEACLLGRSAVNEAGLAPISPAIWKTLRPPIQNSTWLENDTSYCSIASSYTLKSALADADWSPKDLIDCGFIFATTTSKIDKWQHSLPFIYMKDLTFEQVTEATRFQSLGATLVQLQNEFGITGPSSVIASSCSASLQALNLATLWIRSGRVKKCIVGSTEILSDLTVNGFTSMRLLAKGVCKPFDKNRQGINLGEASAFICLEAEDYSLRPAHAFINGIGLSTDAFHPTAPQPDGQGSFHSMLQALNSAGLKANQIDWFYAHGTGSAANDLAESKAIHSLFSNSLKKAVVSSTKSIHGHTLGACGALETVLSIMCLQKNIILPTFNTGEIDPAIPLDIVLKSRETTLNVVLKNSLGFGGINASTVITKNQGFS